jgi:hypothetical protein
MPVGKDRKIVVGVEGLWCRVVLRSVAEVEDESLCLPEKVRKWLRDLFVRCPCVVVECVPWEESPDFILRSE